jgi:hypothetical protein
MPGIPKAGSRTAPGDDLDRLMAAHNLRSLDWLMKRHGDLMS